MCGGCSCTDNKMCEKCQGVGKEGSETCYGSLVARRKQLNRDMRAGNGTGLLTDEQRFILKGFRKAERHLKKIRKRITIN